jgi:acetyl esterase/lipase
MRIICGVAGLMLLVAPAMAQSPSMLALAEARTAASEPDLVKAYGPAALQFGHLRLPAGPGPHPVAVLVHGGCWSAGFEDLSGMAPVADALTEKGFATWNLAYRRLGDLGGGWPGTFEDIAAGLDHLRILGDDHPLDLSRVVVVGHSSGAHLALWAAARKAAADTRFGITPLVPAAVVALDGPGALAPLIGVDQAICGQSVVVPFMGGTPQDRPDDYRAATPQDHLPFGVRQLLVRAELAPLMAPYVAAASASGDEVRLLDLDGADHFDGVVPGRPHGDRVVAAIAELMERPAARH